jgi:periplasmic divalent cation tolerance protein
LKSKGFLLVMTACPTREVAVTVARTLVEAGHAACVNVVPAVHSVYVWRGELQADDEVLLLIKTTGAKFPALREALVAQHPYELPEVIAVGIEDGHHPYLDWLAEPRGALRASGP